jgi:phenylalanyl-tRNA synthetase beta chain
MKLSLKWLKDYIDINISTEELAHKFIMSGSEVEQMIPAGDDCVFEFEITPNRADCLNVVGLAREMSAFLNSDLLIREYLLFCFLKVEL